MKKCYLVVVKRFVIKIIFDVRSKSIMEMFLTRCRVTLGTTMLILVARCEYVFGVFSLYSTYSIVSNEL